MAMDCAVANRLPAATAPIEDWIPAAMEPRELLDVEREEERE